MRSITLMLSLIWMGMSFFATQGQSNVVEDELNLLSKQLRMLNAMERYVEVQDLGRVRILKNVSQRVMDSIETKGLAHFDTFNEYSVMVLTYQNSQLFLKSVQTERSAAYIESINQITKLVIEKRGMPSANRLTAIYFEQIKDRLDDLAALPIASDLKEKIVDLMPLLGRTLASAQERGDIPKTFALALEFYQELSKLYVEFNQLASSSQAFDLTIDIMGLAEFYAEYAGY